MQDSGYPENCRKEILSRSVKRYKIELENHVKWEKGEEVGRSNFRSGAERKEQKKLKEGNAANDNWFRGGSQGYTSTVSVPATTGGALYTLIKEGLDSSRAPKGTKVKVIQGGGRMASNNLMKTNSYPRSYCGRLKCQLC